MKIFLTFILAVVQSLALTNAATFASRESTISNALQNGLQNLLQAAYLRGVSVYELSGNVASIPLTTPYVHSYVNFTGDTQQAIYGIIQSIPSVRNAYVGLQNGGFIAFNPLSQYAFAQNKYTACPASINGAAVAAPCRQIYHSGSDGAVQVGGAVITSASYDCTARPWYTQAVARGNMGWSTLFTFASSSPHLPSVTGVTFTAPFYQLGTATLLGVAAVDVDFSQISPILQAYAKTDMVIYLAETSTYNLVASSTGEFPVINGAVYKATSARNTIVRDSAAYLTGYAFGNTWAADGDYLSTFEGVSYLCNIVSFTDLQTKTLAWKLITCGQESALPAANYQLSQSDALAYTSMDVGNAIGNVYSVAQLGTFFAGSLNGAPNNQNIIETATTAAKTGLTQQALWLTYNVFKVLGSAMASVGMGYKNDGTYASYGWNTDGSAYYAYRPSDATASCAAINGLPAVASGCMQSFPVNVDGTPTSTPFAQTSYDVRTKPFWSPAQSTGSATWSSLFYSSGMNLYAMAQPIYDRVTRTFVGEFLAMYNTNDLTKYVTRYGSGYTAYVYDIRTGYLLADNVGASTYTTNGHFISANASSNAVIRTSASYIQSNYLLEDLSMTVQYNSTDNMIIQANFMSDATSTLLLYVVNVKITSMTTTGTTTTTTTTTVANSDDDAVMVAKNAAISAAVLVAVVMILVVGLLIVFLTRNTTYIVSKDNAHEQGGVVLSPMGKV